MKALSVFILSLFIASIAYAGEPMCSIHELGETILEFDEDKACESFKSSKDKVRADLCTRKREKINGEWVGGHFSASYGLIQLKLQIEYSYSDNSKFLESNKMNCNAAIGRFKKLFGAFWREDEKVGFKANKDNQIEIYFENYLMGKQDIKRYPEITKSLRDEGRKKQKK